MKKKLIRQKTLCKKFLSNDSYALSESSFKIIGSDKSSHCLNELSKILTGFIVSLLSYPACSVPKDQLNCINNLKKIGSSNFSEEKINSLTNTELQLYGLLHGSKYPGFLSREFKERGLEKYNPEDYLEAIKAIFDDRLLQIGNYVRNTFTNVDKYSEEAKGEGSWQDKVKTDSSQKNRSFASHFSD